MSAATAASATATTAAPKPKADAKTEGKKRAGDFVAPPLTAVRVPLPGGKDLEDKYALTLDAVMSAAECAELIALTEAKGYEPALVNTGGRQVRMTDVRNSHRCIIDDEARAAALWARVKQFVPHTFAGRTALGLNERLRFLRYDAGEFFAPHFDGEFKRKNGELSQITIQLYLNSAGEFEGGNTTFLNPTLSNLDSELTETPPDIDPTEAFGTVPAVGRVLLFEHALLHRGDKLRSGRKYCLRTDVMYSAKRNPNAPDSVIPTVSIAAAEAMVKQAAANTATATATTAAPSGGAGEAKTADGKAIETEVNNPLSTKAVTALDNPLRAQLLATAFSEARAKAVTVRPFAIPIPAKHAKDKFAIVLDGVLNADECKALIALTETLGYKKALINTGGNTMQYMEDVRNNDRVMLDDPQLAAWLYARIKPFVPPVWKGLRALGLNERLRFLRYDKGQQFAEHFDGVFERANGERSAITFQLYLNDGFKGGATTFLNWYGERVDGTPRTGKADAQPETNSCVPRTGSVLLFEHAMLHRGDALIEGRKYALRTDIMYDLSDAAKAERAKRLQSLAAKSAALKPAKK